MKIQELINAIDREIISIGRKLMQNRKYDYQNQIDYAKFSMLTTFRDLLTLFLFPNTFDFSKTGMSNDRIFETITTSILQK